MKSGIRSPTSKLWKLKKDNPGTTMAEGQEPGSPTDFMYLYEDEVYKITNRGRCVFGRVVENFCKDSSSDGESEFNLPFEVKSTAVESEFGQSVESNSSDVESDSDTPVQRGEIRVLWHPSGSERVVAKETVGLSDRYIGRGQAVQRRAQADSAGEATQLGRRRDIVITASLRVVGTNHVLPCVLSDRLESLDGCGVGYVCIDGWVGIEYLAKYKLRLQSSDGSRLEYADSRVCPLVDYIGYCRGTSAFNRNSYYPGQVLCGELGSIDKANWIYITDEMKANRKKKLHKHKFTVEALHVSKSVKWLYRVPCVSGTPEKPSSILEGEELKGLKRLKIFEGNALVTGMRHFLSISENDVFVTKKQWQKVQNRKYRRLRKQSGLSKKKSKENEEKYTVPSKPKKRACTSSDSSEPSRRAQKSPRTCELSPVDMEVDEGVREEAGPSISMDAGSAAGKSLGHMPADENNSEIIAVSCSSAAAASARSKRSQLRSTPSAPPPQPGSRVVVETLHTSSRAEVVWQDGTIETGIPSTHLYPFYDLDEQECFPGDFVVSGAAFSDDNNSQTPHGDYGVVQKVDHHGRTAIVKCYRTYTSTDEPVPQLMSESEVSLYDLKKHPDFQYAFRPLVIRVANFTGQDTGCTAGQVIEKCPSGHVKVMWAGGYTSMCWPQDLKFLSHIDDDYDDYELDLLDFLFPRAATENDQALSLESVALLASADSAKVDTSVGATSDTAEDLKGEGFSQTESAPTAHHYHPSQLEPSEPRSFYSAIKREIKMLKRDLPSGVWVRGFEDRIDLMSLMIAGPKKTPYEDGLFLFDLQLGQNYPLKPPLCHYISYCSGMLNPNLYEDGTVCVSLLGTWLGRGVELWNKDSSLLQLIVSLQGLILNAEPYFNEPGYEKQKGSQTGKEKSLLYNEVVLLNLVQSMTKLLGNPPEIFRAEILRHFRAGAADTCRRLEAWVAMSHADSTTHQLAVASVPPPEFPLLPLSRGFCLTLRSSLQAFRSALLRHDIPVDPPAS